LSQKKIIEIVKAISVQLYSTRTYTDIAPALFDTNSYRYRSSSVRHELIPISVQLYSTRTHTDIGPALLDTNSYRYRSSSVRHELIPISVQLYSRTQPTACT